MIASPEIIQAKRQIAAVIHLTVPRTEMQKVMPPAIQELRTVISRQGLTITGPLFAHHLTLSAEKFDFEAGFPVSAAVQPEGRVKPGELPGVRIAHSVYKGPYEGLFQAWGEFDQWVKQKGLRGRGSLWESYVLGPESNPDASAWRTELCLPLAG